MDKGMYLNVGPGMDDHVRSNPSHDASSIAPYFQGGENVQSYSYSTTIPNPNGSVLEHPKLRSSNDTDSAVLTPAQMSVNFMGVGPVSPDDDTTCGVVQVSGSAANNYPHVITEDRDSFENPNGLLFGADRPLQYQPWRLDGSDVIQPRPLLTSAPSGHEARTHQRHPVEWDHQVNALISAVEEPDGASPLICVKNTFLNLEHPAVTVHDVRSRTESADAVLLGAVNTRKKFGCGGRLFEDDYTVYENVEYEAPAKQPQMQDDSLCGSAEVVGKPQKPSFPPEAAAALTPLEEYQQNINAICRRLSAQSGFDSGYTDTSSPDPRKDTNSDGPVDNEDLRMILGMLEASESFSVASNASTEQYPKPSCFDPCLCVLSPPDKPQQQTDIHYGASESTVLRSAAAEQECDSPAPGLTDPPPSSSPGSNFIAHPHDPYSTSPDGTHSQHSFLGRPLSPISPPAQMFGGSQHSPYAPSPAGLATADAAGDHRGGGAGSCDIGGVDSLPVAAAAVADRNTGGGKLPPPSPPTTSETVNPAANIGRPEDTNNLRVSGNEKRGAHDRRRQHPKTNQEPRRPQRRQQDGSGGSGAMPKRGGAGGRKGPGSGNRRGANSSKGGASQFTPGGDVEGRTTIMLRNIPNKYSQQMLLQVIDDADFTGKYDFYYLPIDFHNNCNIGYAFINFIRPAFAEEFWKIFHGYKLDAFRSNKVCEVSWGRVQGLSANIEHYRNSAVMSVPLPHYKPLIFSEGNPIPFPDSDGPLPSVKLRPQKR